MRTKFNIRIYYTTTASSSSLKFYGMRKSRQYRLRDSFNGGNLKVRLYSIRSYSSPNKKAYHASSITRNVFARPMLQDIVAGSEHIRSMNRNGTIQTKMISSPRNLLNCFYVLCGINQLLDLTKYNTMHSRLERNSVLSFIPEVKVFPSYKIANNYILSVRIGNGAKVKN